MVIFHSYVKLPEGNNQHFLMGLWEKKWLFSKEKPQKTMVVTFKSLQPGKPTVRCMEHGWPTAKWLQSFVEHWRNLPPLSTSILEWISQVQGMGVPSTGFFRRSAMRPLPSIRWSWRQMPWKTNLCPKKIWWNMEKDGERTWKLRVTRRCYALEWFGPHSSMSSSLICLACEWVRVYFQYLTWLR